VPQEGELNGVNPFFTVFVRPTMFTPTAIKERLKRQPFQPFRLVTSSGENYEVRHPELVFVGTTELMVGNPSKDDPTIYDRASHVALMHVTAMENLPVKAKKGSKSNGKE
jgi:hypothetical protein